MAVIPGVISDSSAAKSGLTSHFCIPHRHETAFSTFLFETGP